MSPESAGRIEIGASLSEARKRYGMDVREVEERTKIRAKYIRALENEDWETLPAPAYVRGFLRTYGQVLGLDGEMLADEFRRRHGDRGGASGLNPSEPLLTETRGSGDRPRALWPVALAALVAIVVLLLLLSLLDGGGSDPGGGPKPGAGQGQGANAKQGQGVQQQQAKSKGAQGSRKLSKEDVSLTAITPTQVCLLGAGGEPLIDNQVLGAGAKESYSGSKRYRLTIGPGGVTLKVGSGKRKLEVSRPASFEGDSNGIREIDYRGPGCP